MGGCGSKSKTTDADNEPYGTPRGGAKKGSGRRGSPGNTAAAARREEGDGKDRLQQQKASVGAEDRRDSGGIDAQKRKSSTERETSKDAPQTAVAAAAAAAATATAAAAGDRISTEKRSPPAVEQKQLPVQVEPRKSSTSKPPQPAGLETTGQPTRTSTSTTAPGRAVDVGQVSVTVNGEKGVSSGSSSTTPVKSAGQSAAAAEARITSTPLSTKPSTASHVAASSPLGSTLTNGTAPEPVNRGSVDGKISVNVAPTPPREPSPIKVTAAAAAAPTAKARSVSPTKPKPISVADQSQTDIKSVNPDMLIFEALNKSKTRSVDVSPTRSPVQAAAAPSLLLQNGADVSVKTNDEKPTKSALPDVIKIDAAVKSPTPSAAVDVGLSAKQKSEDDETKRMKRKDDIVVKSPEPVSTATVSEAKSPDVGKSAGGVDIVSAAQLPVQANAAVAASTPAAAPAATPTTTTVSPTPAERRSIPRSVVLSGQTSPSVAAAATVTSPLAAAVAASPSVSAATSPVTAAAPSVVVSPATVVSKASDNETSAVKVAPPITQTVSADVKSAVVVEDSSKSSVTTSPVEQPPKTSRLPTRDPVVSPAPAASSVTTSAATSSRQTSTGTPATAASPTPAARTTSDKQQVRKKSDVAAENGTVASGPSVKEILLDLSTENRSIAALHRLVPGSRAKLLQAVDSWFAGDKTAEGDEASKRVLAVYGRAGAGKTCVAADLCRRFAGRHQLVGSHFFHWRATGLDHNRAVAVLQSLARRMCDQLPGYVERLPDRRALERLIEAADASELFDALITQPLQAIPRPEERRLIILDAVDECDAADRDLLLQLLNNFELTTPDWLHLLVTLRDDNQLVARLDSVRAFELKADPTDADAMADLKRFFRDSMSKRIDRISLDGALTQLAKNSDGNILCASFLKVKLDTLPDGKMLALRDLSLTFPVGLSDTCKQAFQGLHDRVMKGKKPRQGGRGGDTAYQRLVGLLLTAREPLPKSAFVCPDVDANDLTTDMNGTLTVDEASGTVSLSHRAVADWIAAEQTPAPLGVAMSAARQTMADTVVSWIGVLGGEEAEDGAVTAGKVDARLQEYALKHAVFHLVDAAKQQDNIGKVLCSLRYVESKLKVPGVQLRHLLADYNHSHYQVTPGTPTPGKLVSLDVALKRTTGIPEQIDHMRSFLVRRGRQLTLLGLDFTLHLAANYPTVSRIQDNARFDLGSRPWMEDLTAVADTPGAVQKFRGTIVDIDVSADQKTIAVVTRVDEFGSLLYVLNALTGEPTSAEIDIKSLLSDRALLCVRFVSPTAVFVGSLTQFVSTKIGKVVDSGLDLDSVKLTDRYTVECAATAGSLLAVGVTTLPWGGRSLHAVVFDVQTKKCVRTMELLKFRFGGSSQYGVKAIGLSAPDGSLLCACVKQTNRAELKLSVWSTGKGQQVATTDLDDETPTKCCFFGTVQNEMTVLLGPGAHGRTDANKENKKGGSAIITRSKSFVWAFSETGSKPVSMDRINLRSACHSSGQQAVIAQRRPGEASIIVSRFKSKLTSTAQPDKRYVIHGLDNIEELVSTDKSVIFVASNQVHLHQFQELQAVEVQSSTFTTADVCVVGLTFVPRTDDPVVAFRSSTSAAPNVSACTLSARTDGIAVGTRLFDAIAASPLLPSLPSTSLFPERLLLGPEIVSYSADASRAMLNVGSSSVQVRDVSMVSGDVQQLPSYGDLVGTADSKLPDSENNTTGSVLHCVVSPKDSVVGIVYGQQPHVIRLFDTKTAKTGQPLHELTVSDATADAAAITDFGFLPASASFVVSFHRRLAGGTLIIWNQRTGAVVSCEAGLDIGYFRLASGLDRLALSIRGGSDQSAAVLRNTDNHFTIKLAMPSTAWSPDVGSSDLEFSGDGTALLGISSGGPLNIWNSGNGEHLRAFDLPTLTSSKSVEIVGMPTNAQALLYDDDGERLLLVDVTSGEAIAAVSTGGRADRKWTPRRMRVSPRGGLVAGVTVDGALRVYAVRNVTSIRRQTTLQVIKTVTSPQRQVLQRQSTS